MRTVPEVIWVIVIFLVMLGGLLEGIFTPTEAGSVVAFIVFIVTALRRDIHFVDVVKSITESLRIAGMILFLIAGSVVFGHFLAVSKVPMTAAAWIVSLPFKPFVIVSFIILAYLIGGSFIDDLAFMILATPIFYPAAIELGYDGLWFGIIVAVTIMIGSVIPPVAMCVFIVRNITKVPFGVIYKGVLPFLIALVFIVILLFVFPQVVTFLPGLLYNR